MADPCRVEGPAVISFSGGRTSGMMLRKILDSHGGQLPNDVRVLFANTGKEAPETLDLPHKEPYDRFAPLARIGISAADVATFWKQQPFDLRLPNIGGKTMHGNCDLCFLKPAAQVFSLIREQPERAIWWAAQERPADGKGDGNRFRNDRISYARMLELAQGGQGELFEFAEDVALEDCACTD
ncbi:adenine nucleotide alpha hydrolase family protein [Pseudothauera rhizosphaerae]|uniref:Phosphoadenosine phosphosulphate reductase domain-containing protein n=1 Tax=Pseudothauera rhizosphaerae TaxID=2565932 RepID=A0A4S4ABA9_9RHOO|nr:hypothetical protein [Pseudothauera rhizosphaerae]THF55938.1 hypothetical protein E6O51_20340 [Pseudothauera rhizosphaerae]